MKELNCKWRWCSLLGSQESTTYCLHGGKRLVGTWKVVLELLLQNESFKHGFSYGTTKYKLAQKTLKGIVNEIENELFFKKSFVRGRIKEKL